MIVGPGISFIPGTPNLRAHPDLVEMVSVAFARTRRSMPTGLEQATDIPGETAQILAITEVFKTMEDKMTDRGSNQQRKWDDALLFDRKVRDNIWDFLFEGEATAADRPRKWAKLGTLPWQSSEELDKRTPPMWFKTDKCLTDSIREQGAGEVLSTLIEVSSKNKALDLNQRIAEAVSCLPNTAPSRALRRSSGKDSKFSSSP
jgi:hypothetical protein